MGRAPSQPRQMVTRLLVLLLLGAIVNVVVAWGCIGLLPPLLDPTGQAVKEPLARSESSEVLLRFFDNPAITESHCRGDQQSRFGWRTMHGHCWAAGHDAVYWAVKATCAGWPVHGLEGFRTSRRSSAGKVEKAAHGTIGISWIKSTGGFSHDDFLPFIPCWPGFAINTVFYAAILWTLFVVPGVLSRKRRKWRGLCVHCAYDLRGAAPGSDNCPECGKPIKQ